MLALWTTAQTLAVIESLPPEFRLELFFWKNIFGLIFTIFGLLIIVCNLTLGKRLAYDKKILLAGIIFPIYAMFNTLFKGSDDSLLESCLYLIWPIAAYLVFPSILFRKNYYRQSLYVIFAFCLIPLIYGMFTGFESEPLYLWLDYSYRLDFDFINPNIFASTWAVIIPCSLYFVLFDAKQLKWKIILFCLNLIAIFFIVQAKSRNSMLFVIGLSLTMLLLSYRVDIRLRILLTVVLTGIVIFLFFLSDYDFESLNSFSSGRLKLWARSLELNYDTTFVSLFTGRGSLIAANYFFDGTRTGFQSIRAQVDSVYISLFLQHGLIGVFLFFFPLIILLSKLFRLYKLANKDKSLYVLAIGCLFGTALQITSISLFPSFGNVNNIFMMAFLAYPIASMSSEIKDTKIASK